MYGKRDDLNLSVPVAGALDCLPDADVLVPPYVLGLWLGDGVGREAALTSLPDDAEHYRAMLAPLGEELGQPYASRIGSTAAMYTISQTRGGGVRPRGQSMHVRLRELGVLNDKHVPDVYLRGSVEQRIALLAGLMDTDGTIASDGREAQFDSTTQILAENVHELLVSLGHRACIRVGACQALRAGLRPQVQRCVPAVLRVRDVAAQGRTCAATTESAQSNATPDGHGYRAYG